MELQEALGIVKENCGHDLYISIEVESSRFSSGNEEIRYSIYDESFDMGERITRANTLSDCVTAYLNKLEEIKVQKSA